MKPSPLNGKVILVVDDEPELRRAIAFDLKRRGCTVFEAGNGTEALAIAKTNSIDIVVSDVRMPNGDGVELLKRIREIHPDLPIVFLATGFAHISEAEVLSLGAQALFEKPIDRRKMFGLLETSCERLKAR